MKLSGYKADYDYVTSRASDVTRQLSYAGIALIWMFRAGDDQRIMMPKILVGALLSLVASLVIDLLHYVISSLIWGRFHRKEECKLMNPSDDPDLDAPAWYNIPIDICFWAKIASVVTACVLIFIYLIQRIQPTS